MTLRIADAHHHLWNPVTGGQDGNRDVGYVWLKNIGAPKPFGDPTPIQRDYLAEEFLSEHPAIEASVHVQADGAIPDPVAETAFIEEICNALGHRVATVGFVDLTQDDCEVTIERHAKHDSFRGVRQIVSKLDGRPDISFAAEHYFENSVWRRNFARLSDHGLSFDLQCYPEQMQAMADLLAENSNIPVIIDHAGSPWDQSSKGVKSWETGLSVLAQLSHVSIKLSGLGMFDRERENIAEIVQTILDLFGPERIMFGSNFPVDKLMAPYGDYVDAVAAALPAAHHDAIFSGNCRRVYKF